MNVLGQKKLFGGLVQKVIGLIHDFLFTNSWLFPGITFRFFETFFSFEKIYVKEEFRS